MPAPVRCASGSHAHGRRPRRRHRRARRDYSPTADGRHSLIPRSGRRSLARARRATGRNGCGSGGLTWFGRRGATERDARTPLMLCTARTIVKLTPRTLAPAAPSWQSMSSKLLAPSQRLRGTPWAYLRTKLLRRSSRSVSQRQTPVLVVEAPWPRPLARAYWAWRWQRILPLAAAPIVRRQPKQRLDRPPLIARPASSGVAFNPSSAAPYSPTLRPCKSLGTNRPSLRTSSPSNHTSPPP